MEAQVWTLIGLLTATLFGALFYLGARIDGQSARIDGLTFGVREQGKALADDIYKLGMKFDDHLRWHTG